MTVKLRPDTEQAVLEVLALLKSGRRMELSTGTMVRGPGFRRAGEKVNELLEIV